MIEDEDKGLLSKERAMSNGVLLKAVDDDNERWEPRSSFRLNSI